MGNLSRWVLLSLLLVQAYVQNKAGCLLEEASQNKKPKPHRGNEAVSSGIVAPWDACKSCGFIMLHALQPMPLILTNRTCCLLAVLLKEKGILGLAGFLHRSDRLLVPCLQRRLLASWLGPPLESLASGCPSSSSMCCSLLRAF